MTTPPASNDNHVAADVNTPSFAPEPAVNASGAYPVPASQPMLLKGVRWGVIATLALMALFAGLGFWLRGSEGLYGGLIGAAIGGTLLLITVGSIAFANRLVNSEHYLTLFFAIVLGAWALKLVAFVVAAVLLRDQPWLDSQWLFIALVATILVSIAIDVRIVSQARIPYVQDISRP